MAAEYFNLGQNVTEVYSTNGGVPMANEYNHSPVPDTLETRKFDILSNIMAYENGELNNEQMVRLFQHLVDTGLAWTLQGHYGRSANHLIQAGLVTKR